MSSTDFEYAIKKDVRNNPIIREVDETRQRQLLRSTVIGGLLVIVLLFSALQHFELLRYGYEIEELQRQRRAEEETHRHLTLEVESLRAPRLIEDRAKRELHMVEPTSDRAIIIERVVPSEPPSKAIVASR
jgi:cell division protein FtsL